MSALVPSVVTCPQCGEALRGSGVQWTALLARCSRCGRMVDLRGSGATVKPRASRLPQAPFMTVRGEPGRGTVSVPKHLLARGFGLLPFAVLAPLFVFGAAGRDFLRWSPVSLVLIGLCLLPVLRARWNELRFEVSGEALSFAHGPFPWTRRLKLERRAIRQIYLRGDRLRRDRLASLRVLLEDGSDVILLQNVDRFEAALDLERILEALLQIEDRPVGRNEVSRTEFER